MRDLLKTDLRRLIKDKLFLVVCILGAVFAVFSPLLYKVLFGALEVEDMLGMTVNAKTLFFSAFSLGSNFGFIVPILISIIICKDFSQGTIRNKIISGQSRTKVFISMLIASSIVICCVILVHGILTLCTSLLFFPYQATAFSWADFGYLLLSVVFEILVYVFVSTLVCLLCVGMKNTGLAVVMYAAVNFLFTIIGSIFAAALMFSDPQSSAYPILQFFDKINLFTSTIIGGGSTYLFKDVLYILLPTVGGSALFILFGISIFKKKDLK